MRMNFASRRATVCRGSHSFVLVTVDVSVIADGSIIVEDKVFGEILLRDHKFDGNSDNYANYTQTHAKVLFETDA